MRALILGTLAGVAITTGAMAQNATSNRVAVETDWSVFVADDPTECFSVSAPTKTVNTDASTGAVKQVTRGEIRLFVTFRPSSNVSGEVSFTGGYPFAEGSTVTLAVGSDSYELFTEGEYAWPVSDAEDAKIVASMKRGADATLTARSARGTQTADTFSLFGFTAAMDEAQKRCSG